MRLRWWTAWYLAVALALAVLVAAPPRPATPVAPAPASPAVAAMAPAAPPPPAWLAVALPPGAVARWLRAAWWIWAGGGTGLRRAFAVLRGHA
jgi:hypothetical protein